MAATLPVVVGAMIGWLYNRSVRSAARRASGRAGRLRHDRGRKPVRRAQCRPDRGRQPDAPLAVVPADFAFPADRGGVVGFVGLIALLYGWLAQAGRGRRMSRELVRPSARPHLPVRHRDVGALLLLRHARAAGLLSDQISAAARPCRTCAVLSADQGLLRMRWRAAAMSQPLSSLIYGTYTGLIYATPLLGGWLADNYLGQRKTAMIGIIADGVRPFHDGVGSAAVSRPAAADFRRRLLQDQHHGPGRHAV